MRGLYCDMMTNQRPGADPANLPSGHGIDIGDGLSVNAPAGTHIHKPAENCRLSFELVSQSN